MCNNLWLKISNICIYVCVCLFVCFWRDSPHWAMTSSFLRFLDHTQRRITVGRTPLDEWSARRRDLYLTTHNTHNKHPCPPVEFEPTISASERPQTHALDRAATGTGLWTDKYKEKKIFGAINIFQNVRFMHFLWAFHRWENCSSHEF
jgi:hypothetical protein